MQAYQIQSDEGIDAIARVNLPEREPSSNEVLVQMKAASLNYRDLGVTRGGYPRNDTRPVIPLSDGAGEVIAVGKSVTRFQVGDRVVNCFFDDWDAGDVDNAGLCTGRGGGIDGVLANQVAFPERALLKIPEHLSFEEAACFPCAGVTAWQALIDLGKLKAGQTVLTLGTGGVSVFGLQIAKLHGVRVIVTSSSDEKLERVRELGADDTINYRTNPEWHEEVLKLTDGVGVDNVIEVGGAGTLQKSLACAKVSGRVSLIGVLSGTDGMINPLPALFNRVTIQGIYVGSRVMFADLLNCVRINEMRPVIDRVFDFDDARDAYHYLKSGKHFGKVVIRINS